VNEGMKYCFSVITGSRNWGHPNLIGHPEDEKNWIPVHNLRE
jgi:hypothetical protein